MKTTKSTDQLEVPVASGSQQRSRSPSPSGSQTVANEFRVETQKMRLNMLLQLSDQLKTEGRSREQLLRQNDQAKNIWDSFNKDHELLGASCKSTFLRHPYMTEELFQKAFSAYLKITGEVTEALRILEKDQPSPVQKETVQSKSRTSKPEIKIPMFDGKITAWPEFRDLFKSLVIEDKELTDLERLQYLKTHLQGEAAKLTSGTSMTSDSFARAWRRITERYNDHDRLVQDFLDKLLSNQQEVPRTGRALYELLDDVKQIIDSLAELKEPVEEWSQVFIYAVARRLPSSVREGWELKKKNSPEQLVYHDLLSLIEARAQALEAIPSLQSSSSKQRSSARTTVGPRNIFQAVTQTGTTKYPCDHCKGDHFIVQCPKFRELHPTDRHKVVVTHRLCFNCMGHHNLSTCTSTRTCKTCGGKHHTMIHLPTSKPASQ